MKTTARPSFRQAVGPAEFAAVVLALACLAATPATAQTQDAAKLTISGAWMRTIIPDRPAGGYFEIANDGDTARTITGAASPGCGMLMLHRSVSENGTDKMEMVDGANVPAHGKASFAPGGFHLMCMEPAATMKPGATVPVTLEFKDGTSLTADFAVRGATGK